MTLYYPDYRIAPGYNNEDDLVALESIIPLGDRQFYPVNAYGGYDPGVIKVRGDGPIFHSGFPAQAWRISIVTTDQDYYIRSTIFGDAAVWSGPVTVRSDFLRPGVFIVCNAILIISKPTDWQIRHRFISNYLMQYTRLVALE